MRHSTNDQLLLRILAASSLAMIAPAHAQNASQGAPAAATTASSDVESLDEIVVTASGGDKTQMNSSVSVTSVSADLIKDFHPSSEAEVFRMIPGIQVAGTSGPGGNSNIAVRGLPVATGGSPFVQIQEDGLPTVLFGDIQFGNNDYWTHFDSTVERVEGVRGGSASTYASQAPGAVINYISRTGKEDGGSIAINRGIGYDETKIDFRNGGHINDSTYYHVGGYIKSGRGPLHADYNVSDSVQVKGNVTKELDDGKGYIRFLFKYADTKEPNYTGAPAFANISGNTVSGIRPYTDFDGRSDSNYSIYNQNFLIVNRDGVLQRVNMDGITTKASSFGNQFHYDFSDGISVDNNMRLTKMSGGFASPFLNVALSRNTNAIPAAFSAFNACNVVAAQTAAGVPESQRYSTNGVIGSCVNGQVVSAIRYASGPNATNLYTDRYIDNNVNVKTNVRDIGSFANDLAVAGKYDVADGRLTARAGWFFMNQKIAMDWHVNKSTREVSGNNPSQLDLYNAAGAKLTQNGLSGFNNNWGSCCARDYDLSYSDNAPYLALDFDANRFGVDASVRFDSVKASGSTIQSNGTEINTNVNGVLIPTMLATGPSESLNYTKKYTSYSLGGLFKANENTSFFVRTSRGGRFNGDRQTVSAKINADGSLNSAGNTAAVDVVNQYELGLKKRGDLFGGRYTAEVTLLKGDFKQSTFELSATRCPGGAGGCVIDAKYKSTGAEFYATFAKGGFSLIGNATYSKAKKADAGSSNFKRADGMPDLTYTISSSYDIGEKVTLGLNTTGQTSAIDGGGLEYPASNTFGAVATVRPIDKLEVGVQIYNLLDKFDLRGNGGVSDRSSQVVIGGAPAIGRTVTATLRFNF
jgi:outer membrane receptor protein involved in Fe transport